MKKKAPTVIEDKVNTILCGRCMRENNVNTDNVNLLERVRRVEK